MFTFKQNFAIIYLNTDTRRTNMKPEVLAYNENFSCFQTNEYNVFGLYLTVPEFIVSLSTGSNGEIYGKTETGVEHFIAYARFDKKFKLMNLVL